MVSTFNEFGIAKSYREPTLANIPASIINTTSWPSMSAISTIMGSYLKSEAGFNRVTSSTCESVKIRFENNAKDEVDLSRKLWILTCFVPKMRLSNLRFQPFSQKGGRVSGYCLVRQAKQ